jgi:murein DD-endopeptidase MepM/ murein hydrolase activator NlpD
MLHPCHGCGAPVDAFRAPARIVGTKVVPVCDACARAGAAVFAVAPPPSGSPARPSDLDTEPQTSPIAIPRLRERARWTVPLMLAVGLCTSSPAGNDARGVPVHDDAPPPEAFVPPAAREVVAPTPVLADRPEPRLVHPLPGPHRELPLNGTRRFGAERDRGRGKELGCGHGHCGVDIGDRVGTPILAVADGVVATTVRYDNDRGGLYVRIDHEDGTSTHYHHLDRIRDHLRPGSVVRAGEQVASLGRSGISVGPAHLHFALSFQLDGKTTFVDPEPMLEEAEVIDLPVPPTSAPSP